MRLRSAALDKGYTALLWMAYQQVETPGAQVRTGDLPGWQLSARAGAGAAT